MTQEGLFSGHQLDSLESALQDVVASILELGKEQGGRPRIYFTGCNAGDGTTLVAAACARALARAPGHHSILLEANLGAPALGSYLGLPNEVGLSDVLAGRLHTLEALVACDLPRMSVLTAGKGDPELATEFPAARMRAIIEPALREIAAQEPDPATIYTLIDGPPLLDQPALRSLLDICHGAVLVIRSGSTKLSRARAATRSLRASGVRVLGAVLNRFEPAFPYRDDHPGA